MRAKEDLVRKYIGILLAVAIIGGAGYYILLRRPSTPAIQPTMPGGPCFLSRNLRLGDRNAEVKKLEVYLFYDNRMFGSPDENFDSGTSEALRDLQERNGLEPTGVLDEQTRTAIFPCPLSGRIILIEPNGGEQWTHNESVFVSWRNTLEFPEASPLFKPRLLIGVSGERSERGCGFGGLIRIPLQIRGPAGRHVNAPDRRPFLESVWTSWCRIPSGVYRVGVTVVPMNFVPIPGSEGLTALDFIHPDFLGVLSDISDGSITISGGESLPLDS
ncbi:MAG: peptidoglycan-binding protein [Chloroflexi bacterium]|nr:peptidoglycan-binding protein [Chloroflexota bacterium]